MDFATLTLIALVGLLGPALASRATWGVPVVIGELVAGVAIGGSGFGLIDPAEPTLTFLATLGFGLTMFVVGSHVPVRHPEIRSAVGRGALGAALVGIVAALLGSLIAFAFGTEHGALYAVLIASSSAALVLPVINSLSLTGAGPLRLIAQVAIADAACIVALPLAIDPANWGRAALGALGIAAAAGVLFVSLRALERRGVLRRVHLRSEAGSLALELRISLLLLFALAALAQFAQISIMLAGFALGLVVAAVGEPRRLARQLFGISEGFFSPLFFVWLGASINLSGISAHPWMIVLGTLLGASAVAAHLFARLAGMPMLLAAVSAAQLGVPIAAVTLGVQSGLLSPGEDSAILLGALVTVSVTAAAANITARRALARQAPPPQKLR